MIPIGQPLYGEKECIENEFREFSFIVSVGQVGTVPCTTNMQCRVL